ncbi:hypothetical protein Q5752_003694 [Cryptotrichosporon argae]
MDGPPAVGSSAARYLPTQPSPILLDTVLLLGLRALYFVLSRRYLLSTLSPTLRSISKPADDFALPTATTGYAAGASGLGSGMASLAPPSPARLPVDYDDVDDSDALSLASPASTRPSSPNGIRPGSGSGLGSGGVGAARERRGTFGAGSPGLGLGIDDPFLAVSPGGSSVELVSLPHERPRDRERDSAQHVLQLTHGRAAGVGTKSVKRAARGLNHVARLLFSLCFAEGCNLLTVVVFHSLGILHSRSRHVNFSVSLHVLLGMILLAVPLVQCLLLTYRSRASPDAPATTRRSSLNLTSRLLISLIPFLLYIFLFTRIPPYITASSSAPASELDVADVDVDMDMLAEGARVMGVGMGMDVDGAAATLDDRIAQWSEGPEGWEGEGWLASSLGRVVVLGVIVLAGLSGLGAVRTAWDFFEHAAGAGSKQVTDNDVLQAERSLYRVRHDLVAKRDELNRMAVPTAAAAAGGGAGADAGSGWMGRVFGSKADQDVAATQAEIRGLKEMEAQVSRSLAAMKLRKRRQGFSATVKGKVYNVLGYVFAIYCVARLLMCLTSLFTPLSTSRIPSEDPQPGKGNTNGDWISFLLALGLAHLPAGALGLDGDAVDVAFLSRSISLLLTGLLILSSLTMVLRSLSRVLRLTSKTVGAGFLLLALGQLWATYVISLLVQLRTSLPPAPAVDTDPFATFLNTTATYAVSDSVGTGLANGISAPGELHADDSLLRSLPDFHVFGRLFDAVFLVAALGTAVFRYVAMKVGGPDEGMGV